MAESQTPTTLQYPGAAAANPFSASFYANQAALQFSEENLLAEAQKGIRQANSDYEYSRGLNTRAMPLALQRNRNTANTQGLAESGVLARQQGQTQLGYAQKNARLGETRRNAVERYQQAENKAKTGYALETNKNVAAENERLLKEQMENPAKPLGSTPANPGGVRTVTSEPGPGGVVGYSERSPRGSVAVGNATRAARQARERAAKKALVG